MPTRSVTMNDLIVDQWFGNVGVSVRLDMDDAENVNVSTKIHNVDPDDVPGGTAQGTVDLLALALAALRDNYPDVDFTGVRDALEGA